jgi:hypothetical protein
MNAPDTVLRKVHQWLAYADEDLRLARHGLSMTIARPLIGSLPTTRSKARRSA